MKKGDFQLKDKFLVFLRQSFVSDVYRTAFSCLQKTSSTHSNSNQRLAQEETAFVFPDNAEKIHEIMRAVHRMDHHLKTAYSMFLGGYRYEEISEKMHISTDDVKERIYSARQELQNILELRECQKN